jgi:hypothetical protein
MGRTGERIKKGEKYGMLTILGRVSNGKGGHICFECLCDCGRKMITTQSKLLSGHTKTCGHPKDGIVSFYLKDDFYECEFSLSHIVFYIDKNDYEKICNLKLCINEKDEYQYVYIINNKNSISLQRFIMNCPKGYSVDHIDGKTLDNRKKNLRICTKQQNAFNHKLNKNNTTNYSGISFDDKRKLWTVRIFFNYKNLFLGRFENFEDAIKSRMLAEEKYFGEFQRNSE